MNAKKTEKGVYPIFLCPTCKEEYETKSEAQKCCTNTIESFYGCQECDVQFRTKEEAQKCCGEWECAECGKIFKNKEAAEACCEE